MLGEGRSERLSSLNGAMRGLDLSSSIIAPLLVGVGDALIGQHWTIALIGVWAAISCAVEIILLGKVWCEIPQLRVKQGKATPPPEPINVSQTTTSNQGNNEDKGTRQSKGAVGIKVEAGGDGREVARTSWESLSLYLSHALLLPSLSYCLLYVSLLSFGGLMTAYLSSSAVGLSPALLAVGRGIAAFVGLISTLTVPSIIARLGLVRSGHLALLAQSFCLGFAVLSLYVGLRSGGGLGLLFFGLCSSRYGLWSFDLVETQILQEGVSGSDVGAINGVQESLMNFSMALSFLLTTIWEKPQDVLYPVWISFGSVLLATALYSYWAVGDAGVQWEVWRQKQGEKKAVPVEVVEGAEESKERSSEG